MLCALPVSASATDQRFGAVNEFRTDASSAYSGLQASVTEQLHNFTLRANYTLSHCLDEVSNGGLLSFSTQGILSPLPGELNREYGNCDYDVRQNIGISALSGFRFRQSRGDRKRDLGFHTPSGVTSIRT